VPTAQYVRSLHAEQRRICFNIFVKILKYFQNRDMIDAELRQKAKCKLYNLDRRFKEVIKYYNNMLNITANWPLYWFVLVSISNWKSIKIATDIAWCMCIKSRTWWITSLRSHTTLRKARKSWQAPRLCYRLQN